MKRIQFARGLLAVVPFAVLVGPLSGCQHNAPSARPQEQAAVGVDQNEVDRIAGNTKLVAHAKNKQIYFKAPQLGRIFLYDADAGQFVYRGYVSAGEAFLFEPASSRAQINKETIDLERFTNEHDEYELYFTPQ